MDRKLASRELILNSLRFTPEYLQKEGAAVNNSVQLLCSVFKEGTISGAEFAALYIVIFLIYRYPQRWLVFPGKDIYADIESRMISLYDLPDGIVNLSEKARSRLPQRPTVWTLFSGNLYSITDAARLSMLQWLRGTYKLELMTLVPSPLQVLDMQCEGRRCVSVLVHPAELQQLAEGKDVMNFAVHDLIHADRFCSDLSVFRGQVGFLRAVRKVLKSGEWDEMMQRDAVYLRDVNYMISDMNASCVHLAEYMKAKWIMSIIRLATGHAVSSVQSDEQARSSMVHAADLCPSRPLTSTEVSLLNSRLSHISSEIWHAPDSVTEALTVLCTGEFDRTRDGRILSDYFESLATDIQRN